jgi:type 1 glutamine amidotransferase
MTRALTLLAATAGAAAFLLSSAGHATDEEKPTATADALKKTYSGEPIKALLITGGCCHNYQFQATALTEGIEEQVDIEFDVVNDGGKGTRAMIDLYSDPKWAAPYDVIVHNECFADTDNIEYIKKITEAHKAGKPAVVIHCAMHTYRSAKTDDWRKFLGVTSKHHEHQSEYDVVPVDREHPIMADFPETWTTPKDELYVITKVWPNTTPLAYSTSEKTGKKHPVFWMNRFGDARVFGTTYGHSDDTFRDQVFIDLLARGTAWAAGKL